MICFFLAFDGTCRRELLVLKMAVRRDRRAMHKLGLTLELKMEERKFWMEDLCSGWEVLNPIDSDPHGN